jgi:hypothetical protein
MNCTWSAGVNTAQCLAWRGRCLESPGILCQCGFWGLRTPEACLARAHDEGGSAITVLGLMSGWGTVAVHGEEGFRSQHAIVRCLFSDRLPSIPGNRLVRWLMTRFAQLAAETDDGNRTEVLRRAASAYEVPLVSVSDAIRLGVLAEMGVETGWTQRPLRFQRAVPP